MDHIAIVNINLFMNKYYVIDERDLVAKYLLEEVDGNLAGVLGLLPVNVFEEGYIVLAG
mgnify:CR=1 FL=1